MKYFTTSQYWLHHRHQNHHYHYQHHHNKPHHHHLLLLVFNLNKKSKIFSKHAFRCFNLACRILCFLEQKEYSTQC